MVNKMHIGNKAVGNNACRQSKAIMLVDNNIHVGNRTVGNNIYRQ